MKSTRIPSACPSAPLVLLAILLISSSPAAGPARAGDSAAEGPAPDVWLVNTRGLPCARNLQECPVDPTFQRLQGCRWVESSGDEFVATLRPAHVLCVYIHGNRMSSADAVEQGMRVCRRLCCGQSPIRFVIWSWPSDRIPGAIRDAQLKAARSDGEAFYLACLLSRLPAGTSVSLIGYSFGARAVTGSLHLLAGGTGCGNVLGANSERATVRPRAVLLAAAMPNGRIAPTGSHGLAWLVTDGVLSFYNPKDPVLKLYQFTEQNGNRARALGRSGISRACLGPYVDLLRQYRVEQNVGCSHDLDKYLASPSIMALLRPYALWRENR